jgi:excisionase family DNA binding protein
MNRKRALLIYVGQPGTKEAGYFAPATGTVLIRDLPAAGAIGPTGARAALAELIEEPVLAEESVDLRLVVEGIIPEHEAEYFGLLELLADPTVKAFSVSRDDVHGLLGWRSGQSRPFPSTGWIEQQVDRLTGGVHRVGGFWSSWTIAIAMAGAMKAWGETQVGPSVASPGDLRPRPCRAHTAAGSSDRVTGRPYLTLAEVAGILGIDRTTVYRMAGRREFPVYPVGRQLRVLRTDLVGYLARQRRASGEERALGARSKVVALPRPVLDPDDEEQKGHRLADELGLK